MSLGRVGNNKERIQKGPMKPTSYFRRSGRGSSTPAGTRPAPIAIITMDLAHVETVLNRPDDVVNSEQCCLVKSIFS